MPETSVIVVNWNGLSYLDKCLASLQRQTYRNFETILVDNGSTDGSVGYVRKNFPKVKIIQNERNLGFAEGVNIGVLNAGGKYIALLNNDAVADKNWLYYLVKTIKSNALYGSVSSASYNKYGGKKHPVYIGTSGFFGQNVILKIFKKGDKAKKKGAIDVFGMAGGACIFRNPSRAVFDKDYFAYSEDTAYGWLMRLKGYHNKLDLKSVVYHEGEATGRKLKSKKIFLQERNRLLNVFIYYHWFTLLRLFPLLILNVLSITLFDFKNILPRVRARLWVFFNFPAVLRKRSEAQSCRKVSDKEIIKYMSCKFYEEQLIKNKILKMKVTLLNKLQLIYCFILRIKTIEFCQKA